jgi:poly-beta-1,6-N-acetyl-D-glucosamine synthase
MCSIAAIFWVSAALVAYIYVGYPALVWLLARCVRRDVRRAPFAGTVSVVVAAYNEAPRLAAKLASVLRSRSQDAIAEIVVASDGSTDATDETVRRVGDPRIRLSAFRERRGKPAVLNDVVPGCRGDVVVLTDARQEWAADALERLLAPFADERVGVVSGELVFRQSGRESVAAQGMGAYWDYEKFIRRQESRFRSVPGATGALYAMRRNLFRPIHEQTLLDDVAIPMAAIEQGYRCVLESGAIAFDDPSESAAQESVRKRRTIAGNLQLAALCPRWMLPWRNPVWFEFVSHKMLRLVSPLLLLLCLGSNALLWPSPPYAALLLAQGIWYAAALAGGLLARRGKGGGVSALPYMFVVLNAVTVLAWADCFRGRHRVTWESSLKAGGA